MDSLAAHAERNDDSYLRRALGRLVEYLRSSQELAHVVSSERAVRAYGIGSHETARRSSLMMMQGNGDGDS